MAPEPFRYCNHPGCRHKVHRGRCAEHERQSDQGTRGTAHARGYTKAWNRYSKQRLLRFPWCGQREDGTFDRVHSRCARDGHKTIAECTDHVVPVAQGGDFWDPLNHMSACLACNTWKAATLEMNRDGGGGQKIAGD